MAEKQGDNPFTNTRLMLAGAIFGVVGVVLAYLTIDGAIKAETGGTVRACYLARDLKATEPLERHHVTDVRVPRAFAGAVDKLVKWDKISTYLGRRPLRDMKAGEPISVYDFPVDRAGAGRPTLREGSVFWTVNIDNRSNPGLVLRLGSVVSLTGNFNFGEGRTSSTADYRTLPVLDRVRAVAINGSFKNLGAEKVREVCVEVSVKTANILTRLMPKCRGAMSIMVHSRDTITTEQGKEIPQDVMRLIIEKLGMPDTVR